LELAPAGSVPEILHPGHGSRVPVWVEARIPDVERGIKCRHDIVLV